MTRSDLLRFIATTLLAALADAGLMASTTTDLEELVAVRIDSALLLPGLILIGALLSLTIHDLGRAIAALIASSVLGTFIFGLAIAAPGFQVEGVRVTLIDRGTTYGVLALMLFLLFGMAGMVVAWLIETMTSNRLRDES